MARTKNPNAVEGQPCLRGDILLKSVAQLNKLKSPGFYAVTSPDFINGSKKFAIDNIPVGDTPRDIKQVQHVFDVGYPNKYSRTLTNGTWSAWTSEAVTITGLANTAIGVKMAEVLLLRNITTKTATGTDPVSLIPASIVGSNILPANTFTVLGSRIRVKLLGRITTGTSTTGKLDIKVNGTTLAGSALTYPNNLSDMAVDINFDITLVTATTVRITGTSIVQTASGSNTPFFRGIASATDITIDPTAAVEIDALLTLAGGAGGSLVVRELTMCKL